MKQKQGFVGDSLATIKDVAKRAGVSISTVSRVLNDTRNVSPDLQLRVADAVEEIGFTTNSLGRALKSSRTHSIGVILTSLSRIFFTSVLAGISKNAEKYGYSVEISETNDSLEAEERLVRYYASQWVDGIIIASVAFSDDDRTRKYCELLSRLEKNGKPIPVVTLEYPCLNPRVDSVVIDHVDAAYKAVKHLLDSGRKDILHITVPLYSVYGQQRLQGYRKAITEDNIAYRDDLVWEGDFTPKSGYEAVSSLHKRDISFDGIFAANDQMALGAIMACKECGYRVPEDVAIIGNDNIFVTAVTNPTLSSISVPRFELGSIAMDVLHKSILSGVRKAKGDIITLPTSIVLRESSVVGLKNGWKDFQDIDW